jgi:hypothetical protein
VVVSEPLVVNGLGVTVQRRRNAFALAVQKKGKPTIFIVSGLGRF